MKRWPSAVGLLLVLGLVIASGSAAGPTHAQSSAVPQLQSGISAPEICKALRLVNAGSLAKSLVERLTGGKISRANALLDIVVGAALTHCETLLPIGKRVVHRGFVYLFGRPARGPPDSLPPIVVPPGVAIRGDYTLGTTGKVAATVYWGGLDLGSGIRSYFLIDRVKGIGGWSRWSNLPVRGRNLTTRDTYDLTRGTTYQFAVSARDQAGNTSRWISGSAFTLNVIPETKGALSGQWYIDKGPAAVDGQTYYSSQEGATETLVFNGNYVAWVAPRWRGGGSAQVFVDGRLLQVVNLYNGSTSARDIVSAWIWPYSSRHSIEIRVLSGRVDVDAFVVLT
jgi:hypothetical protein